MRSDTHWQSATDCVADSGYQGLSKIRPARTPFKKSKGTELRKSLRGTFALTKDQRRSNRRLSEERIGVEHSFRDLKVFRILEQKYRCHTKRFGLRFNLLCAIYNMEIDNQK